MSTSNNKNLTKKELEHIIRDQVCNLTLNHMGRPSSSPGENGAAFDSIREDAGARTKGSAGYAEGGTVHVSGQGTSALDALSAQRQRAGIVADSPAGSGTAQDAMERLLRGGGETPARTRQLKEEPASEGVIARLGAWWQKVTS